MKHLNKCVALLISASIFCSFSALGVEFTPPKYKVYVGDVDGDGLDDVYLRRMNDIVITSAASTGQGSGTIRLIPFRVRENYILFGDSSGNYRSLVINNEVDHSSFTLYTELEYADINNDGRQDLLIRSDSPARASVILTGYEDHPELFVQFKSINGQPVDTTAGEISLEDTNGDGFADLTIHPNAGSSATYLNLGSGGFSFDIPRTTEFFYTASGLVDYVDGPRADVSDITDLQYDGNDNLQKVTNALGHENHIFERDPRGYPSKLRDANDVETWLTYTARGKLDTVTIKHPSNGSLDAVTDFDYHSTNLLQKITQPDGTFATFEYDDAQRLKTITNSYVGAGSGNQLERIEYVLDDASNVTEEGYYDTENVLRQKMTRMYDELSRLHKYLDNSVNPNETEFDYDLYGNQKEVIDALGRTTTREYDALNRPEITIDAAGNATAFEYDERDNITKVTDPRGVVTTYQYDAADNLVQESSSDRGAMAYAYDSANNMVQSVDARGIVTSYVYDALNRMTQASYVTSSAENVTYTYDAGGFAKGRLSAIQDESGQTNFSYDHRGNVTQESRVIDGNVYTVGYGYDLANNVVSMTYPSGRQIVFNRDGAGRVEAIIEGSSSLIDQVRYHPFGRATSWQYGNGLVQSMEIDLDGRVQRRMVINGSTALEDWNYGYDAVHNVDEITKQGTVEGYEYDILDRLREQTIGSQSPIVYDYDAVGNRNSKTQGSAVQNNTYGAGNNRMLTKGSQSLSYDDSGNIVSEGAGTREYTYNARNRLSAVQIAGAEVATYLYNAFGQRVQKFVENTKLQYVYDSNGLLIGEYFDGILLREYVYMNGVPVVQYLGPDKTYLHPDHLGTPRLGTNSSKAPVWAWGGEAFGADAPDQDPNNTGVPTVVDLRFPGQYYDFESGLFYNYFRTYDPSIGRYTQSDPIGLIGGMNTYTYAYNNPVNLSDFYGLDASLYPKDPSIADPSDYTGPPIPRIEPPESWSRFPGPFGGICGSEGSVWSTWIPDGPMRDACQKHDQCYATCGKTQQQCDLEFLRNSATPAGPGYAAAVARFGEPAYKSAQRTAGCNQQCPVE